MLNSGKRKVSNTLPNFAPQWTRKKEQMNLKISGRKEITNIRAEINEKETKKTIKINKT